MKPTTNIIFPALPGGQPSSAWDREATAAYEAGFGISLVSDPNEPGSIRFSNQTSKHIYRGWIVKPAYYQEMDALVSNLLTSYDNYMWAYDFPKWYSVFTNHETPTSIIFPSEDVQRLGLEAIAKNMAERFPNKPFIIKDYHRTCKYEWFDACYIKDVSDTADSIRVMENFFRLRGRDYYGGLVFREFLSLKKLGDHPKVKMPLPIEFRTFFLHQKPITTFMYWEMDVPYPEGVVSPPEDWLESIGKKMVSPFVALDIAQSEDDKWWVIEVNDGGSAGWPEHLDATIFYDALYAGIGE
jgi:hypothetical protein